MILPTEQEARVSARLAAFRVLPTTFGTTQGRRTNLALTVTLSVVVIVQRPVPLQAPDQRRNLDPLAGFALRVTDIPYP